MLHPVQCVSDTCMRQKRKEHLCNRYLFATICSLKLIMMERVFSLEILSGRSLDSSVIFFFRRIVQWFFFYSCSTISLSLFSFNFVSKLSEFERSDWNPLFNWIKSIYRTDAIPFRTHSSPKRLLFSLYCFFFLLFHKINNSSLKFQCEM